MDKYQWYHTHLYYLLIFRDKHIDFSWDNMKLHRRLFQIYQMDCHVKNLKSLSFLFYHHRCIDFFVNIFNIGSPEHHVESLFQEIWTLHKLGRAHYQNPKKLGSMITFKMSMKTNLTLLLISEFSSGRTTFKDAITSAWMNRTLELECESLHLSSTNPVTLALSWQLLAINLSVDPYHFLAKSYIN